MNNPDQPSKKTQVVIGAMIVLMLLSAFAPVLQNMM